MVETPIAETLGGLFARERKRMGLSLRQVRDRTGLSVPYLSKLESNGFQQPSGDAVARLLEIYTNISPTIAFRLGGAEKLALLIEKVSSNKAKPVEQRTDVFEGAVVTADEALELQRYLKFLRTRPLHKADSSPARKEQVVSGIPDVVDGRVRDGR